MSACPAKAAKINSVPVIPYSPIRAVMTYGHTMDPKPVVVHDIPVAILRFSLKYVFNAREFADCVIPIPDPGKLTRYNNKNRYLFLSEI